jgi:hypothetical protein
MIDKLELLAELGKAIMAYGKHKSEVSKFIARIFRLIKPLLFQERANVQES